MGEAYCQQQLLKFNSSMNSAQLCTKRPSPHTAPEKGQDKRERSWDTTWASLTAKGDGYHPPKARHNFWVLQQP